MELAWFGNIACTACCALAMVANGALNVPGFESLPLGETKKFALGVGVMVTFVDAVLVVSVTEVAVTVTLLPLGTELGAVYWVFWPLLVLVGENEPQLPEGEQLQVTPPFAESLVTCAPTSVTAVTPIVPGGAGCSATEIDADGVLGVELFVPPAQPASISKDSVTSNKHDFWKKAPVRLGITSFSYVEDFVSD